MAREASGLAHVARLNDEVTTALDRLELLPEMGAPVRTRSLREPITRRIILDRSGYHLYPRAHLATGIIEVVRL